MALSKEKVQYITDYLDIDLAQMDDSSMTLLQNLLFYADQYSLEKGRNSTLSRTDFMGIPKESIRTTCYKRFLCTPKPNLEIPQEKEFITFLSHDVDLFYPSRSYRFVSPMLSVIRGCTFRSIIKDLVSRSNPYNTIKKILDLERKYNAKSTFFFISAGKSIEPYNYDIADISKELALLEREGHEIGLHGSYKASYHYDTLKAEKQQLEKVVGKPVKGYRNHGLRFTLPASWRHIHDAGFQYDSTFGYNDAIGYRNGLCFPFYPFDIENDRKIDLLELSPNIMDKTLFVYLKWDFRTALESCYNLIDEVKQYHGLLTLNWHTNNFDGRYGIVYEKMYEKILQYCGKEGAVFYSGNEVLQSVR